MDRATELVLKGRDLMEDRRYDAALRCFLDATALDVTCVVAVACLLPFALSDDRPLRALCQILDCLDIRIGGAIGGARLGHPEEDDLERAFTHVSHLAEYTGWGPHLPDVETLLRLLGRAAPKVDLAAFFQVRLLLALGRDKEAERALTKALPNWQGTQSGQNAFLCLTLAAFNPSPDALAQAETAFKFPLWNRRIRLALEHGGAAAIQSLERTLRALPITSAQAALRALTGDVTLAKSSTAWHLAAHEVWLAFLTLASCVHVPSRAWRDLFATLLLDVPEAHLRQAVFAWGRPGQAGELRNLLTIRRPSRLRFEPPDEPLVLA